MFARHKYLRSKSVLFLASYFFVGCEVPDTNTYLEINDPRLEGMVPICVQKLDTTGVLQFSTLPRHNDGIATIASNFSEKLDVTGQKITSFTLENGSHISVAQSKVLHAVANAKTIYALRNMLRYGTDLTMGYAGGTEAYVRYGWDNGGIISEIRNGELVYRLDSTKLFAHLSAEVQLIFWDYPSSTSQEHLEIWQKYYCALSEHQNFHLNPLRQNTLKILEEASSLRASSESKLTKKWHKAWRKGLKNSRREIDILDRETNFGPRLQIEN